MRVVHQLAGDGADGPRAHAQRGLGVRGGVQPAAGYHQYKFIVDGEWRHDENQAFIQDPLGNVNNWCERRVNPKPNLPRAPHAPASSR